MVGAHKIGLLFNCLLYICTYIPTLSGFNKVFEAYLNKELYYFDFKYRLYQVFPGEAISCGRNL